MKLFRRGLLDLVLLIALPIGIIFSLLTACLGTIYAYSLLLFIVGTINLFNSFEWLHYRPLFFRKINRLHMFDTPKYLVYATTSFLLFVAVLVFVLSRGFSVSFCLLFFCAYALLNWGFIRLIKSIVMVYARLLPIDAFNWAYWLKTTHPPKPFVRSIWFFIFSYKVVTPEQLIRVIDFLFKRKYYYSLIQLQQGAFGHLDIATFPTSLQIRVFKSIDELYLIAQQDPNIPKQLKDGKLKLPFSPKLSLVHLTTILDFNFMVVWLDFANQSLIQRTILMDYFGYLNEELSDFVANPRDCYLDHAALKLFKAQELLTPTEQIVSILPLNNDLELQETVQYTYSLLLIAHGIALNLE